MYPAFQSSDQPQSSTQEDGVFPTDVVVAPLVSAYQLWFFALRGKHEYLSYMGVVEGVVEGP